MSSLIIHPELHSLIPPLSTDEMTQLTANLRAQGCRDALIIWQEENVLLDGHNRYTICQRYELPYTVHLVSLPNLAAAKAWMLAHQLGRRNLTAEQMSYLRGKHREFVGQQPGGDRRSEKSLAQNELLKSDEALAAEHKVGVATLKRDTAFARSVDTIAEAAGPGVRQDILARDTKMDRQDIHKLATIARHNPTTAKNVATAIKETTSRTEAKRVLYEAGKQLPSVPRSPSRHDTPPMPAAQLVLQSQEPRPKRGLETISAPDGRAMFILHKPESKPVFNKTNEMVDWAAWTWNPVTGCWHGCDYCYAREIANDTRMQDSYPKQFEPTFHPARLDAPKNTPLPQKLTRPADKNVFTCSMADLFGKWVPEEWILQVFARVRAHPEWNFLFLTKFPQRLQEICDTLGGFPVNAWVGCTVDAQARVATAERAFRDIQASVRWLSVEPMRERLTFQSLEMFDWLVMGGQTASYFNKTPAMQPAWEWVEHLWEQARTAQVKIYWKENLTIRPKEVPWS